MRYFVVFLAFAGLIISSGCANTAQGFGKDLEKTGQSIQKSVGAKPANNPANAQQQYYQQQAAPAPETSSSSSSGSGYTPTPSGY